MLRMEKVLENVLVALVTAVLVFFAQFVPAWLAEPRATVTIGDHLLLGEQLFSPVEVTNHTRGQLDGISLLVSGTPVSDEIGTSYAVAVEVDASRSRGPSGSSAALLLGRLPPRRTTRLLIPVEKGEAHPTVENAAGLKVAVKDDEHSSTPREASLWGALQTAFLVGVVNLVSLLWYRSHAVKDRRALEASTAAYKSFQAQAEKLQEMTADSASSQADDDSARE